MKLKRLAIVSAVAVLSAVSVVGVDVYRSSKPMDRLEIQQPVYTIGELAAYSTTLSQGRKVMKFGPMFFGLYPGGIAFPNACSAQTYLNENGWDTSKWMIYQTSGDFRFDVTEGFTNKSLLVKREAPCKD